MIENSEARKPGDLWACLSLPLLTLLHASVGAVAVIAASLFAQTPSDGVGVLLLGRGRLGSHQLSIRQFSRIAPLTGRITFRWSPVRTAPAVANPEALLMRAG